MKIAFCCGCLEPGRDGVGDYVRRLAGELNRYGHRCVAIALNDSHVSDFRAGEQASEGVSIPVLRLAHRMPFPAGAWLRAQSPDWLSLQFVPFAFHPRGLGFGLGQFLAELAPGVPWHVMFHELWLGLGEQSSLKERVWGAGQRHIVLDLMRRLRPPTVHTQAEPYRLALSQMNIRASLLPLFSNIAVAPGDGWSTLLEPLVAAAAGARLNRRDLYLAGILGAVHSEWNAAAAINTVLPLARQFQKRLVLVFHGRNNLSPAAIQKLKSDLGGQAIVVMAGERSSPEISHILQALDLGLATTPLQAIQKSGSAAAMLEHGLTVLVTRDDWHLRGAALAPAAAGPRLLTPRQFATLAALPTRAPVSPDDSGLNRVAAELLASLASAAAQKTSPPPIAIAPKPFANRVSWPV